MQPINRAAVAVLALSTMAPPGLLRAQQSGTVPLILEDNRVFVELTFHKPDGSARTARAWVDTGGGSLILTERLAGDLGLARTGPETSFDDSRGVPVASPSVFLGSLPLDASSAQAFAVLGTRQIEPGVDAEAFLPARVLMRYDVVFDYPGRAFTIALPGALKPRGRPVPTPVDPKSGFPRIELSVGGEPYGFLLDTGASYTMISRELLERWAGQHASWPRLVGAVGEANMLGGQADLDALLLRLPSMRWGEIELHDVGVVSRRPGIFEKYMSRMMTGPIVGALAGNVLKNLRIEIDYPKGMAYVEPAQRPNANDLETVGIILEPISDGNYRITGASRRDNRDLVEGVRRGDQLLSVDGKAVAGASRDTVLRSLQGRPGDKHRLRLLRDGKEIELEVAVQHLL